MPVPNTTQDAWMDTWWYRPWIRWCVGVSAFTGVSVLFIQAALDDGDAGVFGFLAIGLLVLVPLERLMPRHRMKVLRPEFLTDLLHVFFTTLLSVAPLFVLFPLLEPLRITALADLIGQQPTWLKIAEALFLTELLIYWGHRLSHQIPLLWRFHSVHHSIRHLDWLAGERRHPIDGLYMALFTGIPLMISGFDLVDLLVVGLFNGLWDMTIHANLGWRLKFLDRIWVTTEYHHWHHSLDPRARDTNFAGALPIMDLLFGTYYLPEHEHPGPYGIDSHMPTTYVGQLLQPFR